MVRKKYVSQADLNHRKFGSKWTLPKAKKFFKTLFGTDKFVEPHPHIDFAFIFQNDHVFFEAHVGYGSTRIELQSVRPYQTIGYYDFATFQLDHDYTQQQADRRWSDIKKEIVHDHLDWLNSLSQANPKRFEQEIQRIKEYDF